MWCMAKRLSLSLESGDEAMLARFMREDSPDRGVLISWIALQGMAPEQIRSEAAVLRVLLRVGAERLHEQALDDGYAKLASELDTIGQAEIDEARRRYVRRSEATSIE
jgi:hypothetical protein